jgi:hypothetical protein
MGKVCSVVKNGLKSDNYKQIMRIKYKSQDENIHNKCIFDTSASENKRTKNRSENRNSI